MTNELRRLEARLKETKAEFDAAFSNLLDYLYDEKRKPPLGCQHDWVSRKMGTAGQRAAFCSICGERAADPFKRRG